MKLYDVDAILAIATRSAAGVAWRYRGLEAGAVDLQKG